MKSTGIVRKIDDLGRLVIPKELRKTMGINKKDPMEIFVDGDRIILNKYEPACIFCGSMDNNIEYEGRTVCKECIEEMNK
ncbi:transcriptional pleiotropic regulator of transition state genes [Halanaerobium saccharolyticum]|uniref:Transcriptional pleiotropic regulator of transition state genes n=1 Tax=Halanaerobium saccharolyticum TaxID=43595 RepID=A0A4R7YX62_9FIRM|nr:AbrB/MazE/SpoVT family DNA-binding domain-containing protein [Halanaerobium saccharolyticum]RAK08992.1 transcriptional pleiotropic regulator of transition state genes [Halanaerobium saccharolyticum]TDW02614.1 transcriptional pleiotropic regulator of transition state genes [Halanaerobium saccharolyticum]TDX60755.1 transcriptional pleiotropic regulator of transition state genes [Halanaerobium saccharolyticum]